MTAMAMSVMSCNAVFDAFLEKGEYKKAEELIKKTKGNVKYEYAETLIREYIDLEEYGKAINVYEKLTPEHCDNDELDYPSSYGHGKLGLYEDSVTKLFREKFLEAGMYDKVWAYSLWKSSDDTGYNAEMYYRFMSDVILYLCSKGEKEQANKFLNHYVYWFDSHIDNDSHYFSIKPEFRCDIVRAKLQKIINTY